MKGLKKIPKFQNEAEERKFWQETESTEYVDYSKMEKYYMQGDFDFLMGICSKADQYNFTPNVVFSSGKVQKYSKNKYNSSLEYEDFGVSLISKSVFFNKIIFQNS